MNLRPTVCTIAPPRSPQAVCRAAAPLSVPVPVRVPVTADQVDLSLKSPEAKAALDESFAILAAHAASGVAASLLHLPAAQLMFHGTPASFDKLEPRPNQRIGREGQVEWSGTAIFAAMDSRVALQYTASRDREVSTGVNLRSYTSPNQPLRISLFGGDSLDDALNRVYGDPSKPETCVGYIHLLDKSDFVHEPGLGCMEKLTRDSSADLGQIAIDRRAALADLQHRGLVTLDWFPQ